jgi:hypothetical protein
MPCIDVIATARRRSGPQGLGAREESRAVRDRHDEALPSRGALCGRNRAVEVHAGNEERYVVFVTNADAVLTPAAARPLRLEPRADAALIARKTRSGVVASPARPSTREARARAGGALRTTSGRGLWRRAVLAVRRPAERSDGGRP